MPDNSAMFPIPADAAAPGVSHLQWLAGVAMQSIILRMESVPHTEPEREEIALWSYRMAQAMKRMEVQIHVNDTETH